MNKGDVVAGKYNVLGVLGRGGMSTVYHVRSAVAERQFALKVLDMEKVSDPNARRRFTTEARAASLIEHENSVRVFDFGYGENDQPYIAMECLNGETLDAHLKKNGAISLVAMANVALQLASAITAAHSKAIIHRDLKPGNIMVMKGFTDGVKGSVKVIDYGIAQIGAEQNDRATAFAIGSPVYMSPEQCAGKLVDKRTDVYSLGCVFYEALTGSPPFVADTALRMMALHEAGAIPSLMEGSLGKSFPESVEMVVQKMLEKNPNNRYQDVDAAVQSFVRAVEQDGADDGVTGAVLAGGGEKSGVASATTSGAGRQSGAGKNAGAHTASASNTSKKIELSAAACLGIFIAIFTVVNLIEIISIMVRH